MPTIKTTDIPDFHIRPATEGDVGLILSFIRELAVYERMADEVVADEAALRESLFGRRPSAEVLIGELAGEPVTFA